MDSDDYLVGMCSWGRYPEAEKELVGSWSREELLFRAQGSTVVVPDQHWISLPPPLLYLVWNKHLLSATPPLRHLKRGKGIMHAVLSGDEITVMDGYSNIGSAGSVSWRTGQTTPLGPSHRALHQP